MTRQQLIDALKIELEVSKRKIETNTDYIAICNDMMLSLRGRGLEEIVYTWRDSKLDAERDIRRGEQIIKSLTTEIYYLENPNETEIHTEL